MVPTLSDAAIGRVVGQQSLARGFVYATTSRVLDVDVQSEGVLTGRVRGGGSFPYDVRVEIDPSTRSVDWSVCSCFVGTSCKHVAAVLIAYRLRRATELGIGSSPVPEWQRSLDALLSPAGSLPSTGTRTSAATTTLLGMRIEPVNDGPLRLRCRPVRPGKAGKWVQQGVSWSDLTYDWRKEFDPGQRAAVNQLHQIALPDRHHYYGSADWLDLSTSPRLLWTALAELAEVGVPLLPGSKQTGSVEVSPVPAELFLDVAAAGENLTVTPRLMLDGVELLARRSDFLGEPAHGVVYEFDPGRRLLLAPLTRTCDPATRTWLERLPGGLSVPAADRERFLAEFAPRLRQAITLTSTDGSVDFPEPTAPTLALTVNHADTGRVSLDWSVHYRVGTRTVHCVPETAELEPGLRDATAELERWTALAGELGDWARRLGIESTPLHPVYAFDGIDAATFCAEAIPLLEGAGVDVVQTGAQRSYRHSDAVPEVSLAVTEADDRESDWFDLAVEVTLDEEKVPFDLFFAALAREQSMLILPSGTYFSLHRPEFARLADLIAEARLLQDRDRRGLRINVRQPSLWEDLVACGAVTAQADRWRRAVQVLGRTTDPPAVPTPAGLHAELRPYQQQGYAWLHQLWSVGIGGILADDMGLGKTLQALALICAAHEHDPAPGRPFLVVAPTSVVTNWAAETARFTPGLRVVAVERTERKREQPLYDLAADADVVITSYTLLRIDAEHYEAQDWRGLILDEAQFVKNYQAKTYACIRRLGVGFTVAMTGTPLENSLMDLWSMLSLTAPGMFPSPQKFTEYYRTPIERGEAPERLALLQRRIAPVLLRRTKDIVAAELPVKQEQVLEVALHERHARIYSTQLQRERQKVLRLIEDLDSNRLTILASLTLLRQLSLEAALVDEKHAGVPSAKADLLTEMLPELVAEGHRALVFSQFTRFLRRIGDRLTAAGVPYAYLDGQTRNRATVIEDFRSGRKGAFLISLKAGGFGLNLTEADYCFVCDPWWNPAAEAQAVDRAHRIGQTRPVMVYRLVSKDTIEEKVMALKARKEALFSSVLGSDGLPAGALTSADIRSLLSA